MKMALSVLILCLRASCIDSSYPVWSVNLTYIQPSLICYLINEALMTSLKDPLFSPCNSCDCRVQMQKADQISYTNHDILGNELRTCSHDPGMNFGSQKVIMVSTVHTILANYIPLSQYAAQIR